MSAETLRRASAQIRNDHGGVVSRQTRDGRRWLPVADWLDESADDLDEDSLLDSPESGDYMPTNPEALWCDYCGGAIESPDYAEDDQRCKCERWHKALAVARAYLGESA